MCDGRVSQFLGGLGGCFGDDGHNDEDKQANDDQPDYDLELAVSPVHQAL